MKTINYGKELKFAFWMNVFLYPFEFLIPVVEFRYAFLIILIPMTVGFFITLFGWIFSKIKSAMECDSHNETGNVCTECEEEEFLLFKEPNNIIMGGYDGQKYEIRKFMQFLSRPDDFLSAGVEFPKGVLIHGERGCGKTLLIKYANNNSDIPFYGIHVLDTDDCSVIIRLFDEALKNAPSVIYLDEIENLNKECVTLIVKLLSGLDNKVIIIATTNDLDSVNPELRKYGRLDREIYLDYPRTSERKEILHIYEQNKRFESSVSLDKIAEETNGFSGAKLEFLLNDAAIISTINRHWYISIDDIYETMRKIRAGSRIYVERSEEDRKRVAYHEAGHAVMMALVEGTTKNVSEISIVPRVTLMGYVMYGNHKAKCCTSKEEILNSVAVLLAGRCAELLFCYDISDGSDDDLAEATKLLWDMILKKGMDEKFGSISVSYIEDEYSCGKLYDDAMVRIRELINQQEERVKKSLAANKNLMDKVAEVVMEKGTISKEEFDGIMKENSYKV